jgi:hypothetical protein
MRWSRVVFGWGACLALSWAPVLGQEPIPLPMLPRPAEADACVPNDGEPDATWPGELAPGEREPMRLAQAPSPTAATVPPNAAPGATPAPSPAISPGAMARATPPAALGMFDASARVAQISGLTGFGAPEMFGDAPPLPFQIRQGVVPPCRPRRGPMGNLIMCPGPPVDAPRQRGVILVPSVRGVKIVDNQSPQPQDRIFYDFNYFEDINKAINLRERAPVQNIQVYRHTLGLEKTFLDRRASIGFRLPINTLSVDSLVAGLGGTHTSAGDLSVFTKFTLLQDQQKGYLISTGLAVTAPTGPAAFAGSRSIDSFHNTELQPFVGYLFNRDRFYAQGFLAIDVPTNPNDVTILFNDFGVGYFVYRSPDPDRLVSAIAPNFEVHVNTPLNHRGFHPTDPAGTPDFVNLTLGTSVFLRRRARLLVGVVDPVTGPRPFDFELLALLNIYL